MQQIKVIAFDADDTLWDNQVFYDKVEKVNVCCNSLRDGPFGLLFGG